MKINKSSIPNILSIIRIFLAIIVMPLLLIPSKSLYSFWLLGGLYSFGINWFAASLIFLIAVITDFVDGHLARKYKWISEFGKVIDPIADKILINSVMIILSCLNIVPIWITLIFIVRDTGVDSFRIMIASRNSNVAANIWGKFKTILQMVGIIIVMFIFNSSSSNTIEYHLVQNIVLYLSAAASIFSGYIYIRKSIQLMVKNGH
jgi:CDP-diacylglycerol--glycerol-3-phosphate 3-phosphatidyltransferase